jgi:membrane-associated phospholipid phosphatase
MIILDTIGHYGPILVFLITIYNIFYLKYYFWSFLILTLVNAKLNEIFKLYIREPRPKDQIDFIDHNNLTGAHAYGMPSGHAQGISFSIIYLYLVKQSNPLLYLTLFIGGLTLYQRWKYHRHTIGQLTAGFITGSVLGYYAYYLTNHMIHYYQS